MTTDIIKNEKVYGRLNHQIGLEHLLIRNVPFEKQNITINEDNVLSFIFLWYIYFCL